jgi:hypothetical protein
MPEPPLAPDELEPEPPAPPPEAVPVDDVTPGAPLELAVDEGFAPEPEPPVFCELEPPQAANATRHAKEGIQRRLELRCWDRGRMEPILTGARRPTQTRA